MVCRDVSCHEHWYTETDQVDYQIYDQVDYQIYDRIRGTKPGELSVVHFDSATQRLQAQGEGEHLLPARADNKELFEYVPNNDDASAFELRLIPPVDEINKVGGAAVCAKVPIPERSYVMPTNLAASFEDSDGSMENIKGKPVKEVEGVGCAAAIEDFIGFVERHGHPSLQVGSGTKGCSAFHLFSL